MDSGNKVAFVIQYEQSESCGGREETASQNEVIMRMGS